MKNGYDMVDRMFEEIRNSEKHELSLESAFEFIEFYGLIDGCTLPANFGKKEFVGNCALRALNNNFERLSIDDKGIDELVEMLTNDWGLDIILAQTNKEKLKSFIVSNGEQLKEKNNYEEKENL